MSKFLIAVLILSFTISTDLFQEFDSSQIIKRGLVSPTSKTVFSYIYKEIDCGKLKQFGELYKKYQYDYVAYPKIEKGSNKKLTDNTPQTCKIYFENLLELDQNTYWNAFSLVKSFNYFLKDLVSKDYRNPFPISINSFAYKPSIQRYAFIDIKRLYTPPKLEKLSIDIQYKKHFRKTMAETFFKSIVKSMIPLTLSEVTIFTSNFANTYDNKLVTFETKAIQKKIVKEILNTFDNRDGSDNQTKLVLELKVQQLSVGLGKEKRTFNFENPEAIFMLYLCRTKSSTDECINVNETYLINDKNNFYIEDNLRYDVDIRESSYIDYANSKSSKKIIEIFLVFVPKDNPGIVPSDYVFFKDKMDSNVEKNVIILCENESKKVKIGVASSFNNEAQTFNVDIYATFIRGNEPIHQIPPSYLGGKFDGCNEPNTKVFLIDGSDKHVMVLINQFSNALLVYSHAKTDKESQFLILKQCDFSQPGNHLFLSEGKPILTYNQKSAIFPSEVVLKYDDNSQKKIEYSCFNSRGTNLLDYKLSLERQIVDFFIWNFNMNKDETSQSVVYLNTSNIRVDPGFRFSRFAWPKTNDYVIFISIFKKTSDSQYDIQAVFFNEKKELIEVLSSDKKQISFSSFPQNLLYDEEDSNKKTNRVDQPIEQNESVYLSGNEIVYQLEISNFKKCHPQLKIEDKKNIRIHCASCLFSCDGTKIKTSSISRNGLLKVITQSKLDSSEITKQTNDEQNSKVFGISDPVSESKRKELKNERMVI